MKRIHKTFSLSLIALLGSLVAMATAQQGENPALNTLEGPALNAGQFDETQQRIPSQSSPAATIPPTLNPPRSNPFLPEPTLTAPRSENYGAERVPRCAPGAANCPYERERAGRAAYLAPPTGYVPYGGLGIDRQYDYHRASRYHYDHDRRASYDYYHWMNRFPPSPYRPCPYGGCPNGFGY